MRSIRQAFFILTSFLLLASTASCVSLSAQDRELAALFVLGYKTHDMGRIRKDVDNNLGGIIWFRPNTKNKFQVQRDIAALKTINSRLLVMVDQEGGKVQRFNRYNGFVDFDLPRPEVMPYMPEAEAFGRYTTVAKNLAALGININLAPVVDLNISQMPGSIARAGRSYGELEKVVQYAGMFIETHFQQGLLTSLKHFPGHGSAEEDTHDGFTDVSHVWSRDELEPYRQLLRQMPDKIQLVMSSHLYNKTLDPDYPASMSPATIDILTEELGYSGAIISDDMHMRALSGYSLSDRIKRSINAGHHLLIFSNQFKEQVTLEELVRTTRQLIARGEIKQETIRKAVQKVRNLQDEVTNNVGWVEQRDTQQPAQSAGGS